MRKPTARAEALARGSRLIDRDVMPVVREFE
jgi:hypothetical protein